MRTIKTVVTLLTAMLWLPGCTTESAADDKEPKVELPDVGWPRTYRIGRSEVVMFQPQLEDWEDYKHLPGRSAVAVTQKAGDEPIYGAMYFDVSTETSFVERQVLMTDFEIEKLIFPGATEVQVTECEFVVEAALPFDEGFTASLDRVIAAVDTSKTRRKEVKVNLDPPPIFHSETLAYLVIFNGEPKLEPIEGTDLLFVTNTNWDVFLHTVTSQYYLRNGENWFRTGDLKEGPWEVVQDLPAHFTRFPDDANWAEVKKNVPGKVALGVPKLFVSYSPAELILVNGEPSLTPIPDTRLLYVENTDSDLFLEMGKDVHYYLLTAGRWFRARDLEGPWESAMTDLPEDFAKIPVDHEKASVLSSVPGTDEAEAAMVLASVPQKATVNKEAVKVEVAYQGEPKFKLIEGNTVYYAVNTPYDVLRVGETYYCCHSGVWFVAVNPKGPWVVAESVPDVIYTIPPDCPVHHVTYVYVYDSTPDTVVVGYTSGYHGCYITSGVVVYGCGYYYGYPGYYYYYDDDWYDYHCHSYYYSYGCGAWYDYHSGTYYRGAYAYGPYGGAGRAAAYDPSTGTWSRSAYRYGPAGEAYARQAYNPRTGNYAAGARAETPYGSWGRGVVSGGDNWARAGYRSDSRGTVGGIRTSEGGALVGGRRSDGSGGAIGRDKHGDLYVGRDGEVYRRNGDQWQKKESAGGWSDVDARRAERGGVGDRDRAGLDRGGVDRGTGGGLNSRDRSRPDLGSRGGSRGETFEGLNRDRLGRQNGSRRAGGGMSGRGSLGGHRGGGGFRGGRR